MTEEKRIDELRELIDNYGLACYGGSDVTVAFVKLDAAVVHLIHRMTLAEAELKAYKYCSTDAHERLRT